MKKAVLVVIAVLVSTISFGQKKPKIKGDKNVNIVSKVIIEDFNAIEIDDALEVEIKQGEENNYTLTADANLQDIVQFSVKDSILKIYTVNRITSSKKLEISLGVKEVQHIILKNDAKIESQGRLDSEGVMYITAYNSSKFELDVKADDVIVTMQRNAGGKLKARSVNTTIVMNDRTDLKASVQADKTRVTLTKSAQLTLNGDSDFAAFNLKDSSELDAKKMKVSNADLYTSNNSDVYVYAGKNLELYAQGKSNIYVYGDPKLEVKGLTDKSKIIKK